MPNFKQDFLSIWTCKHCIFTQRFSDDNLECYSKQCIGSYQKLEQKFLSWISINQPSWNQAQGHSFFYAYGKHMHMWKNSGLKNTTDKKNFDNANK